jgi:hypothetical protein
MTIACRSSWAGGASWIPCALVVGHLTDHERPTLDLFPDQFELGLALLLGPLACGLHPVTSLEAPKLISA